MNEFSFTDLLQISLKAGREILDVYEKDFGVQTKSDDSPLTEADQRSHNVIMAELTNIYPEIPVLSEEGTTITYEERKNWDMFWLVDPLDGTKEFVKRNGEFTVNIALIKENYPVLGIIYAPVTDTAYFAKEGHGSFKVEKASELKLTNDQVILENSDKLPLYNDASTINVVASRSHMSDETKAFVEDLQKQHDHVNVVSAGSSLKFCLVAEGKADYYPRYAPTMEWDTGAGQAIIEGAGGKVTRYSDNTRFRYNKENLRNDWFLVSACHHPDFVE
ncbi:3'(2'),5'-bisphosphate nucleotidase CysQ [Aquibacillus kalidii]|uniref:3'(2'),5'-bisphosphate nucleotidase CysQ n=1 Tax=Aquibacillus kalidii TaxID=2762597 RepID=UPI001645828A|nr:3'(2'),5'-bisphosphate nucleotidase CysQ [Aquibacillus kalidii]